MNQLAWRSFRFLALSLVLGFPASAAFAEKLPDYRPALIGNHSRSFVNLINAQGLMTRGQGDGLVLFDVAVSATGSSYNGTALCYRASPNSEALQREVVGRLEQAQFVPAVYKGSHVAVWLSGIVTFHVRDGKPHVRVFLHQEEAELQRGGDFVAPQLAGVPGNTKFKGIYYPRQAPGHPGAASVRLSVNADGEVQSSAVAFEDPKGMGFGVQTAGPIRDALFIPGFRNGKRVACSFTWTCMFRRPGLQMAGIF
jgi:hypothetical protein